MSMIPSSIGAEGALAAASVLSRPADEFGNDPGVEAMWAMKAFEHAEIYFNLLCSVDPQLLKLTPHDNKIYEEFRTKFPAFKVETLDEDALKSPSAKEEWRPFCNAFTHVEDFNYGTLLRLDSSKDYTEENSILVTRIQFFAIEIARNREGFNDAIRANYKNKLQKRE